MLELYRKFNERRQRVYIQLSSEEILLKNATFGNIIADVPVFAVKKEKNDKTLVVGFGRKAIELSKENPEVYLKHCFGNANYFISDAEIAEALIRYSFKLVISTKFIHLIPYPIVIIHPLDRYDLKFRKDVDSKLYEICESMGTAYALVHYGPKLTDNRIKNLPLEKFKKL